MFMIASRIETLPAMAMLWLINLVPLALVLGICWIVQRRRPLAWREMSVLAVGPYVVWAGLFISDGTKKGFGNLLEATALGILVAVLAGVRLSTRGRPSARRIVPVLYSVAFGTAVLLWLLVPGCGYN